MILWLLTTFLKVVRTIFLAAVLLGALASVFQEQKIWKNPKLPSLQIHALIKVYLMNVVWMTGCALGSLLTPLYCLVQGSWDTRPWAHTMVERTVGKFLCDFLVAPVEVVGMEHIPQELCSKSPAPVFIANHDSQIDLAAVYFLEREWRWIAKSSVMFLPGVGQIMFLSRHVFIDRVNHKSKGATGARNLYLQSNESLQSGVPMFFFPQGTRRLGERLPFKDGAFKVALENKSVLVPISLEIPLTAWNSWYPFVQAPPIKITVHPPMATAGKDIETLKKESFETIYSVLPDHSKQS
jgi:1-acyl-sn-glycerol-3-phosphate acyltransferase